MSASQKITYTVLTRNKADWQSMGTSGDMQTALLAAENLLSTRRYLGVKVDKQFFDDTNKRFVTATIFERARTERSVMPMLVMLAVLGGVASFAVTYVVIQRFL